MVQTPTGLTADEVRRLRDSFAGDIVLPSDDAYDDARRLWNSVFDLRPAVIVRPASRTDVATAIRFARDHDLPLAVRSGGHSASGHSSCDGGLVVDMSRMRGVSVDPATRLARVNGGALLGELDVAAQAHGLVCPTGVIGHTGVAGLTLGGGVGRLQRNFGLTIDNLRAVELVTADGRFVRTSETEEPDLFWGMRGAGWNFGIATAFEFELQPFGPDLHRGVRIYPASAAREVWEAFDDYAATAPDAVSLIYGISPPEASGGDPVVVVSYNHSGAADAVERDTAGLRRGPEPSSVSTTSEPYLEVQTAHDLVLGWGGRSHISGLYADVFRPEALDAIVDHVADGSAGGDFSVTLQGGAIARVDEDAMAFAGRAARFDLSANANWVDAGDDGPGGPGSARRWRSSSPTPSRAATRTRTRTTGRMRRDRSTASTKMARLAALKRTWDPDNVFRLNHNVEPAGTGEPA